MNRLLFLAVCACLVVPGAALAGSSVFYVASPVGGCVLNPDVMLSCTFVPEAGASAVRVEVDDILFNNVCFMVQFWLADGTYAAYRGAGSGTFAIPANTDDFTVWVDHLESAVCLALDGRVGLSSAGTIRLAYS